MRKHKRLGLGMCLSLVLLGLASGAEAASPNVPPPGAADEVDHGIHRNINPDFSKIDKQDSGDPWIDDGTGVRPNPHDKESPPKFGHPQGGSVGK
jgi:hypothetical protein